MKIIFFSSNIAMIDEWKQRHSIKKSSVFHNSTSLKNELEQNADAIVVADYDSIASELNAMLSSGFTPNNMVVLEKEPSVVTGKMLIMRGTKAYGNSRMLTNHFKQMIETVEDGNIWTYPELTALLAKKKRKDSFDKESKKLIENRLSDKEQEVLFLIFDGLTNDAIASLLNITTRTVKAHISSIFSKLHVNDRVSLILLLR